MRSPPPPSPSASAFLRRITDLLEGESLVNDATGLLALEFGIAMVARRPDSDLAGGALRLAYLTFAGVAVGLITGWIVDRIERRIDDGPIEIALSILVPYVAYLTADRVRASGVLAVVACGLYLSRRSSGFFSPGVRLQAWAVWDALDFILNGVVFVLIGLQLPYVLAGIHDYSHRTLFLYGALFSALVIALRVIVGLSRGISWPTGFEPASFIRRALPNRAANLWSWAGLACAA